MICHKCGKEIPNDSMFCPECGTKQEAEKVQYCMKCGEKLEAGSRFCTSCGTKQTASESEAIQNTKQTTYAPQYTQKPQQQQEKQITPEQQAKRKKTKKWIGLGIAAAAVICAVIFILTKVIKPTIHLNDYITITFEGYDSVGKAVVTFDRDRFIKDYEKKLTKNVQEKIPELKKKKDENDYLDALLMVFDGEYCSNEFLSNCVDGELDKTTELSNGDTVKYTWDCNEEAAMEVFGYKIKYSDIKVKVSGLKKTTKFDPFEGIKVVYNGIAPQGTAEIEGETPAEAGECLYYSIDCVDGLSNGDTITVTAEVYSSNDPVKYCIENYGMIPSPLTKTYKVEGLASYVKKYSEISSQCIKELQNQAESVFQNDVDQNWGEGEKLNSLNYAGYYLLTRKDEAYWTYDNLLYLVYEVSVDNKYANEDESYGETNTYYWYISFSNLVTQADGTTTVEVSDYQTPYNQFAIDSGVNEGWWSTKSWWYNGYTSLEEMYSDVVTSQEEEYNHEEQINAGTVGKDAKHKETKETEEEEESIDHEDGIIFPQSSEEVLDYDQYENLTDEELRYAINELYARHGYIFKDETLLAYYRQFDWYEEKVKPEDFNISLFNAVEKENVELLQKERDDRK